MSEAALTQYLENKQQEYERRCVPPMSSNEGFFHWLHQIIRNNPLDHQWHSYYFYSWITPEFRSRLWYELEDKKIRCPLIHLHFRTKIISEDQIEIRLSTHLDLPCNAWGDCPALVRLQVLFGGLTQIHEVLL